MKTKVFQQWDIILQLDEVSKLVEREKLMPNWEGSYKISKVIRSRAYNLENLDGTQILRSWNFENLKKYYQ